MSKYTTELRFLLENGYDLGMQNYPLFDPAYRTALNQKIYNHFYFREIGFETPGRFKHYLNQKMNEIMPLYNQLYQSQLLKFNPLYGTELTETLERKNTGIVKGSVNGASASNVLSDSTTTDSSNNKSIAVTSDTPQGLLSRPDLDSNIYASNAVRNETDSTGNGTGKTSGKSVGQEYTISESDVENIEDYTKHVFGTGGVKNYSELLNDFRSTFLNIDLQIIEELSTLFMGVF